MGEFKTAVEFVLGAQPTPTPVPTPGGGGEGGLATQTGDIISMIAVTLFALVAIFSLAYFVYSCRTAGVSYSECIRSKSRNLFIRTSKIALGTCMVASLVLCGMFIIPSVGKAMAANEDADQTIKVYVDPETETITSDPTNIVNKTASTAYISSTSAMLSQEAIDVLKTESFNLKIDCPALGNVLYDKPINQTQDLLVTQPFASGQQAQASLTITGLDFATAKLLVGINVFTVTFGEAPCHAVTYDANGATSGTAPAPQAKIPDTPLTIAKTTDLVKDGYNFVGWNTKADGTGEEYALGATYTEDADLKLFAHWTQETPVPAGQYRISFKAATGGSVSLANYDVDEGSVYVFEKPTESLTITKQDDATDTKTITATASEGYRFKEWQLDGATITQSGSVNTTAVFTAVFEEYVPKQEYRITYKVLNVDFPHGEVALNTTNPEPQAMVYEDVTPTTPAKGATAIELQDQDEKDFVYFFNGWTIDDEHYATWSSNNLTLSAEDIAALDLADDTVFIAHFVAPVTKYTEENSTMVFSCEEVINEDDSFTFPVYNSHWDPDFEKEQDFSKLTFPAWCNYDGTQKVYPRTVKFLESFKSYKKLTSTSFWFNTLPLFKQMGELIIVQPGVGVVAQQQSVLTNVIGLENIYTNNLTETVYMFACSMGQQVHFQGYEQSYPGVSSLDFSSWNINPKDSEGNNLTVNMKGMFQNCNALKEIILPTEEEGNYFATYASDLSNCFSSCTSLSSISLKKDFGINATDLSYMFNCCRYLKEISINDTFGKNAVTADFLFGNCSGLMSIKLGDKFGEKCSSAYSMFYSCYMLENVNLGKALGAVDGFYAEHMFYGCESLKTIDLSYFKMTDSDNCYEMLGYCSSLEQFTISDKWSSDINMSAACLRFVDSSIGWFKGGDQSAQYTPQQIPSQSQAGTFCLKSAKAIFNPQSGAFTFYYDSAPHTEEITAGGILFPVRGDYGFIAGMVGGFSYPDEVSVKYFSNNQSLFGMAADAVFEAGNLPNPIHWERESWLNQSDLYDMDYLRLPSWYKLDYENYKIENKLKALGAGDEVKVVFDQTFNNYPDLQSTSCWFIADSNSYAPFTFTGFTNVPTQNIVSTACMFGGFCFEMYKRYDYWYEMSDRDINLGNTLGYKFVSPYLDTYNWTLKTLDLSTFNILISSAVDYAAICANCKGLTTVTLPSQLCDNPEDCDLQENSDSNSNIVVAGGFDRVSFSGTFYCCDSLTTITNIGKFNPFTRLSKRGIANKYSIGKMFYGCKSLTSLDLSKFATIAPDRTYFIPIQDVDCPEYIYMDIFTRCENLGKFIIGQYWGIPMDGDFACLPDMGQFGIKWQWKQSATSVVPVETDQIPYKEASVGDNPDCYGEFERDMQAVKGKQRLVTITSANPEWGTVSESSYPVYLGQQLSVRSLMNSFTLNNEKILATSNEGYSFSYWEFNDEYFNGNQRYYRVEEDIEYKIVAHFKDDNLSAKAVYTKENKNYDNHNTLTFYYDNLDHSYEGEVFEVKPDTFVDIDNGYVNLPSWYQTKYMATGSSEKEKVPIGTYYPSVITDISSPAGQLSRTLTMDTYNPFSTSNISAATQYDDVWRIQTLIEPKDVIFTEGFKNYDELTSISMWFMADQFGTQTVENFYSPEAGNIKNPGFKNLYTKNLLDVSYAFGGLFEPYRKIHAVDILGRLSVADALIDSLSAIDNDGGLTTDKTDKTESLWSKGTETYGTSITNLDLTGFDFSNIYDMSGMFANCVGLAHIKFDESIEDQYNTSCLSLFANCENLGPDLSNSIENWDKFNTDGVYNFDYMFYGCSGLETMDLSNMNTEMSILDDYFYGDAMFSECTRLYSVKINTQYDPDSPAGIKGWGLNFAWSGMSDCKDGDTWKNEQDLTWTPTAQSSMIPYDSSIISNQGYISEASQLHSGTFVRNKLGEKKVDVVSNDTSLGTVDASEYGYIENVQVKTDTINENALYLDNRKITATPKDEDSRFSYWEMKITNPDETSTTIVIPSGFTETYFAEDDLSITITAVFNSNATNGFVAFSADANRNGTFTFYYGAGTDEAAQAVVPEGQELITVFDVKSNTSDYVLPSWYRKYQESWYQGDNHPVPKFVRSVEANADKITINFHESFASFKELRSMSCWFMGALSHTNEAVLYNPFDLTDLDFTNVNTSGISNVAYMFGGHEYFNEIHGSKNTKVSIKNFDTEGNITNLTGLFANLPKVEEIDVDAASFKGMKNVTNTSKMFYNTYNMSLYEGEGKLDKLDWLHTENVVDMSYMFAKTFDIAPKEEEVTEGLTLTLPKNFVISNNALTLKGMFSGYANWNKLTLDFSKCIGSFDTSSVVDTSYMFQNCWYAQSIELVKQSSFFNETTLFNFENVVNMSHMYENCTKLSKIVDGDESSIPSDFRVIDRVSNFTYMFAGCTGLEEYDIPKAGLSAGEHMPISICAYMFSGCTSLKSVAFNQNYNWGINMTGANNLFMNSDGTSNTTLEHFTLDVIPFSKSPVSVWFVNFGLSNTDGTMPIAWVDSETLNYYVASSMPDWDDSWYDDDYHIVTFDRCTTTYAIVHGDNYSYIEGEDRVLGYEPLHQFSYPGLSCYYIGCAEGYTLTPSFSSINDSPDGHWQDMFFELKNKKTTKTRGFAVYGWCDVNINVQWWYQEVADPSQKGQIDTDNPSLPPNSSYIYFPCLPDARERLLSAPAAQAPVAVEETPASDVIMDEAFTDVTIADEAVDVEAVAEEVEALAVLNEIVSLFVLPTPLTFINFVLGFVL